MNSKFSQIASNTIALLKTKDDFELEFPLTDTIENKRLLFKKIVLERTVDNAEAVTLLVSNGKGAVADAVVRIIFEIYLQTALIMDVDTEACFDSFFAFADYQKPLKISKIGVEAIVGEKSKRLYLKVLGNKEYKQVASIYSSSIESLKSDFKKKYGKSKYNTPRVNENWWAGLTPSSISNILGGLSLDLYNKLYWHLSNMAHSSPYGHFYYSEGVSIRKHDLEEESLVLMTIFCVFIGQLLFGKDDIFRNKLESELVDLGELIKSDYPSVSK